jgi:hypothetical protein
VSDLIKAMNPAGALPDEDTARKAAQVSAIGMILGAVNTVAEGWYSANGGAEASQQMAATLTGKMPTAEEMEASAQFGLIGMGLVVVLQLVLAAVQWRKPNSILPMLFLVLVIWALGMAVLALLTGAGERPMWLTALTIVTMTLAAALHIAGIRGASALQKFRQAQAY